MKKGRTSWITKISPRLRGRIGELLAARDKTDREIFDALNLTRHTSFDTFRAWCVRKRRELLDRSPTGPTPKHGDVDTGPAAEGLPAAGHPCTAGALDQVNQADADTIMIRTLEAMLDALETGRVKSYVLPGYIAAMAKLREVSIKEAAERRADEIHAAKVRELRKALEAKSDGGTKAIEYGDVVDLVDKIMRGEAA